MVSSADISFWNSLTFPLIKVISPSSNQCKIWETVVAYDTRLQVDFKQSQPKNTKEYFLANDKKHNWNQNISSSFKGFVPKVLILIFPHFFNFLCIKLKSPELPEFFSWPVAILINDYYESKFKFWVIFKVLPVILVNTGPAERIFEWGGANANA